VDLKIVEAHGHVRDVLRAEGLEARVGSISRRGSLAELVEACEQPVVGGQPAPAETEKHRL
jgi:hypothetical protein